MSEYILVILWLGMMYYLVNSRQAVKEEWIGNTVRFRTKWIIAIIVFLPIIFMAGTRNIWFGDTSAYVVKFNAMPDKLSEIKEYVSLIQRDAGFYAFSAFIKCVLTRKATTYLMILAGIQGISLIFFFRKYSENYLMSVFLFVASADYISWMYNGIRQFFAVIIVLFTTGLVLKKRYITALIIILIAATFHQSVLLMIPLIIIAQGKAWNKKTLIFIVCAVFAIIFVSDFTNILDMSLENTQYTNVVNDFTFSGDDGTNPLRVLVYCVPAILAFLERNLLDLENDCILNYAANMSIISAAIYLVSMVTSGIYIGRLPIYASLYGYILIPWELRNIHYVLPISEKAAKIILVVMYLLFYYYQLHIAWGLI